LENENRADAENKLFQELEKGSRSIREGRTLSLEELSEKVKRLFEK
jgi:hypothetical protein